MQLFSYNPHTLLFITFPSFICLIKCYYYFSQHVLASQLVSIDLIACFLAYALIYCFDVVFLAFLGQDMSTFHVCTQIHMILASLPCLCLDLHVYVFFAMFILKSTCQCLDLCSYAQIHVFMHSIPCLCAQIYVGCYAMCYFSPFCPLISLFFSFWPFQWGVDLNPVVQAYICTPRPILKGFDHFLYMCMLAFLLLCFISILVSLDLGFAMLCALCGFVLVWLHPSLLGFVWM